MLANPSPKFKGVVLRHLGPWLVRTFSREVVDRAVAAVPPESRRGLDPSLPDLGALAATWYDARVYQTVFDVCLAARPDLDRGVLARDAAEAILGQTLHGIYSGLFRLMATPALYARYAQKMWDTHYDTGKVVIEHSSPVVAHHRVEGWAGHHDFVCALNRQSGAVVYSMMGLRGVVLEGETCAPPTCSSTYRWR
jgi:hypothetical protein